MQRTRAEINELAKAVVAGIVAELFMEFPGVARAVDKVKPKAWQAAMDDQIEQVREILLTKFGSSD